MTKPATADRIAEQITNREQAELLLASLRPPDVAGRMVVWWTVIATAGSIAAWWLLGSPR